MQRPAEQDHRTTPHPPGTRERPVARASDGARGTAIFQGFINVSDPTNYTFSLGSDDDAWLFIDGQLVGDEGGVKQNNSSVFNTGTLNSGDHTVSLFFADRHTVQSGIDFDPSFQVTATPEPSSLALMATGLVGFVGVVGRKSKKLLA